MTHTSSNNSDGHIHTAERVADLMAIQNLATAYAHAVDDLDWPRWQALFLPDARIDYTSAGGIKGNPAELAAWMPTALSIFEFSMHTTSTHEVNFTDWDAATGRVHVFNRNGVQWEGRAEIVDVGAVYEDTYARADGAWRFASRVEHTKYITGGTFADLIRQTASESHADNRSPLFG